MPGPKPSRRLPVRIDDKHGVSVGEVVVVEQQRGPGTCGDHQVATTAEEVCIGLDSLSTPNSREAYRALFHRWQGARNELPAAGLTEWIRTAKHRSVRPPRADRRRVPTVVDIVNRLPAPRHVPAVDRLPWRRRVVSTDSHRDRRIPKVLEHVPLRAGVDHGLLRAVALDQESRTAAELCHWPLRPPVPDECAEHVAASAQVWGQIYRLIAPVHQVRPLWTRRHHLPVREEAVATSSRSGLW